MIRTLKQKFRRWQLSTKGVIVDPTLAKKGRRIGDQRSGWWIYPDELTAESVVYSFGVGRNISFDQDLSDYSGATVHLFDPTPRTIEWIKSQDLGPRLAFHDYGIADFDGVLSFFAPKRESSAHFAPVQRYANKQTEQLEDQNIQAPVKRLSSIMESLGHQQIDLLKIDIEGGEYDVLQDIRAAGIPIKQLAIEFHHCYRTIPLQKTVDEIKALKQQGFELAHISERTYEYTFISKK